MKFNYAFSNGDIVYSDNNERLTIKKRCGTFSIPSYWVMENDFIYAENALSLTPHNLPVENEEEIKKDCYEKMLLEFDKENEELSKYSRNLNLLALNNKLAMTYNREKEVQDIKTILLRRTKPNPLLIGQPGCGKTAIVEELARQYVNDYITTGNPYTPIIYDLSLNSLVSGAKYRGTFEERLQKILEIVKKNNNIIIFIDEIHQLNSVGNSEGAVSTGQILKPALARGEIRCIGATTIDEFNKHIWEDKALTRRFSVVKISAISGSMRYHCIESILHEYGNYFEIDTSDVKADTLLDIVDNFTPDTVFPDNIIDIIDETLATAKYNNINKINDNDIKKTASRQNGIIIL